MSKAGESKHPLIALDLFARPQRLLKVVGKFHCWLAIGIIELAHQTQRVEVVTALRIAVAKIIGQQRAPTRTEPDAALTAPDAVSLEAAYQSAIDQHHSTSINFDVEGSAALDQNSISLRDHALVDLEAANPALKVAFTVAAQPTGLDANALSVLQSAKDDGVRIDAVKILVEHFGQSADGNSHTALISAVTAAEKQLADLGLDAKLGIAWDGNSAGAHADGAHAHDAHVASSDASGMVPQPFEFSGVLHHHDNIG